MRTLATCMRGPSLVLGLGLLAPVAIVVVTGGNRFSLAAAKPPVVKLFSIPVNWESYRLLDDVNCDGLVVVNRANDAYHPAVALWSLRQRKEVAEVPLELPACPECAPGQPGPFKFVRANKLVGLRPPWVVGIDLEGASKIRRVLPSEDLLNRSSPFARQQYDTPEYARLAVSHIDGLVAAAFNMGKEPRVFILNSDLTELGSWVLPRYVQDVQWSPDGKKLAVLYSGKYGEDKRYMWYKRYSVPVKTPDVVIFDPQSGGRLFQFLSGAVEARIAFSSDGAQLYCLPVPVWSGDHRDAIRVFSASDGTLLRTITVRRTGVHDEFTISPDGRFIAANASTPPPHFFLSEPAGWEKTGRFVILDAKTGRLLFEHHEVMAGTMPVRLAFSRDSRLLLVDPNHNGWHDQERIDVYSLEGLQ